MLTSPHLKHKVGAQASRLNVKCDVAMYVCPKQTHGQAQTTPMGASTMPQGLKANGAELAVTFCSGGLLLEIRESNLDHA